MKKLITAALAAGLLLSASACSAPRIVHCGNLRPGQDRCVEPRGQHRQDRNDPASPTRSGRSSRVTPDDSAPALLQAILDYADESVKENPDAEKLNGLKTEYEKAGSTYSKFCSQ